jgi:hypothetical protein
MRCVQREVKVISNESMKECGMTVHERGGFED